MKKKDSKPEVKKPMKPHDVNDVWDIETHVRDCESRIQTLDEVLEKVRKERDELDTLIIQGENALSINQGEIAKFRNYKDEYMDFDDALNIFIGYVKRGRLHMNDSRIDPDDPKEMRFSSLEGEIERQVVLKACRSTGTSWQKGFADGSFDYTILWFSPEIKAYILSQGETDNDTNIS